MSDLSRQEALAARSGEGDLARRFGGVARLYGTAAYERFAGAHVAVIGIGGVGSWAAEALARSAVGRISLIDLDHIAESNANRQIHALGDAFGRAKVEAMAERIVAINPAAQVHAIDAFVTEDNVARLLAHPERLIDAVIDCIDEVRAKAALLAWCRSQRVAAITCGAAGGRVDPTRIRHGDLARAHGDPLLAKLRYRLRRHHGFPADSGTARVRKFGIMAVFSDEPIRRPFGAACDVAPQGLACAGYGSSVSVTAPLGFAAVALALQLLASRHEPAGAVASADIG